MQHNDLSQSGANLNEATLNISNVNSTQFGLVFTREVDDLIFAQPLIATQVNLGSDGTHNLAIVATANDSVYAFDADNASVAAPYWQVSLLPSNAVAISAGDVPGCPLFGGNFGIVGTPVIDAVSGTLYVVARTKENGVNFVQRLHALDIASGAERANSPVVIQAACSGTASDGTNGVVTFNALQQNQRTGLALVNGVVYICWASQCDIQPYHGWIMGYNETNLAQVVVYNNTANGNEGGIWMSGAAPSADSQGNLYFTFGNGPLTNTIVPTTSGAMVESFVQMSLSGTNLTPRSYFIPYNWQSLDVNDFDVGSAGLVLIPNTSLAFSGGKAGYVYLVNRNSMGGLGASSDNVLQSFAVLTATNEGEGEVHGTPVWWSGPGGPYGYVWPSLEYLQQYTFSTASNLFQLPAIAESPAPDPHPWTGGILSLSANGSTAGSGILWASIHLDSGATSEGVLHAYNAQNVGQELWNSEQVASRDAVGNFAQYVPPTVANGKVYLATFSDRLNVYGLLNETNLPPPSGGGSNWVQSLNFRLTAYRNGEATTFPITTKMIISSLSGLVTNAATGQPVEFSTESMLLRAQPVGDTNEADSRYFVQEGKPAVQTDVTSFFVHSIVGSVSHSTSTRAILHEIDSFSLVNDPTISFSLQGIGTTTFGALPRSTNMVPKAFSANVSGTGTMPNSSPQPVIIYGTISASGGKLQ